MNSKRMYYVMLGIVVLLIGGLVGGAYGVNSLLQQRAQKLHELKTQHASLVVQKDSLAAAKAQVDQYSDLKKIAKTVVPQDKDQAVAVREIVKLANDSGIKQLSSVTFPASNLGASTAKPGAGTSTTGPTATPASPTIGAKQGLTQLIPAPGLPGVYQLQITINQTADNRVTYNQFYDFLTRLEQNRRTAQVVGITLQPNAADPNMVAFTLIINEFIKP